MISGLPNQGTILMLQATFCTTAGPTFGELAHQEPWDQTPLPARTPTWRRALQKRISWEPQKHGHL